ncbi:hypothetical protein [Elizabethkingia anophelis]|uniref:hypothetical protein n=1 Tax=Elizabethkingia anophelis TaxID=1117645 RepID=UPI0021AA478C|nr:hypothetical protein [Elizabethkingia anophelis]
MSPSSFISAELVPVKPNGVASTVKNLNTMVAVSGESLVSGVKFRVIACRASGGSYQNHQDYTLGQPAQTMMLDGGVAYDIVVYLYGSESLPMISSREKNNIRSAIVNYDDRNRDFMCQKISYTPDGNKSNNTLNITLRHKVAQITTVVRSNGMGNITNITDGLLTPHYIDGSIPLLSSIMSARTSLGTGSSLIFQDYSWSDNINNYTTASYFRNSSNIRTLMLPTVGYRHSSDGCLMHRGQQGLYWSSSFTTSNAYS